MSTTVRRRKAHRRTRWRCWKRATTNPRRPRKIPIYGCKSCPTKKKFGREDPRHQKDSAHGWIPARETGKSRIDGDDDLEDDGDDEDSSKKPLTTSFELNDTLYAEAELEETDTVYLWLGANVMLSYSLSQAITLLKSKLETAEGSLRGVMEDLEFLREQITVMEVNTARLYNWDVKRRRERREKEQPPGAKAGD